ncbi:hypothetical protein LZ32DRAFT_629315 [Colletotrichum eremochloae]|nr:hypothetical protein LZ32DRAFT_629315 [Colletotrichum eremochloae]
MSVLFEPNVLFMSGPSAESDTAWDALMPSGRGYVLVEHPEDYNLKPGIPTDVGPDRYSVTGAIRASYYANANGKDPHIFGEDSLSEGQKQHARQNHINHCFDYLRQGIMCAADMTLESAMDPPPGDVRRTVDGWGIVHQCRSWDDVLQWTLDNKAPASNHTGLS